MSQILVVDDHEDIRELVKRFLDQHGYPTFTACDGVEMKHVLETQNIDLIVLDIMMPGEDGFSLCKSLRQRNIQTPVIMLTAMTDDTEMIVGLEIGADDYLTKPFNPRELLARIKAVLRRTSLTQASTATNEDQPPIKYVFGSWQLDINKRELSFKGENDTISLSTAEYDLLHVFLQHPQTTLSRDQLLDWARGRSAQVFDRSIDTLISRLRKKLRHDDKTEDIIKTVWGGGYNLASTVEPVYEK